MTVALLSKPVGLLKCQINSYLKTFKTTVISCSQTPKNPKEYELILEDTILFPEGGGQPYDFGTVNQTPVSKVLRKGLTAVHYVDTPFEAGAEVELNLDFERRWDFMQQHSGQHLLSAILENDYKMDTLSWELGKTQCHIQIKSVKGIVLNKEFLDEVEKKCNDAIIKNVFVTSEVEDFNDTERPESLPADYVGGVIRHIVIEGIDRNPCCGTHVTSLSHCQCIKLGVPETIPGGNYRLPFWVGSRVMKYLSAAISTEKQLNNLLSVGPEGHIDATKRLLQTQRELNRAIKNFTKEVSNNAAQDIISQIEAGKKVVSVHREDGNLDYVFHIGSVVSPVLQKIHAKDDSNSHVVIVSAGQKKTGGPIMVFGKDELVSKVSGEITKSIPGVKGGGKGAKWQGKSTTWKELESTIAKIASLEL
ncbi:hypothetical protein BB558_004988 [Smittium angustum]|uniref:Threonyl/alanyl tRNA synthetase SAD domain-containing protein n=1 Tax=Smittium angustum TaxID=133377 RepID=A0A2U1IXF8_SMIAN|nr:hypothetical protein BB558_006624 [Smittium angustum]PVZ99002.1 hypothetical protein BB558_004988 [Smittium angustum]